MTPTGVGTYRGTQIKGNGEALNTATSPAAMGLDNNSCLNLDAVGCRDHYLKWLVGLNNGTSDHRCKSPGSPNCSLVGDIVHSTPRLTGRPSDGLQDESYETFKQTYANRDLVLYTSSNDGFLHAFRVAPGSADGDAIDSPQQQRIMGIYSTSNPAFDSRSISWGASATAGWSPCHQRCRRSARR